jgi:hypothetical protein
MKPSNRLLALFAGAIGLLALMTLLLVLIGGNKPVNMLPENSPEGIVQRYLLAIDNGNYPLAFSYISLPPDDKTTYDIWLQSFNRPTERPAYKATLGQSIITGDEATVEVVVDVFRSGSGPFSNPVNSNRVSFFLKNINGVWKITSPTYVWWIY